MSNERQYAFAYMDEEKKNQKQDTPAYMDEEKKNDCQ